jgi:hypothetical protein
MPGPRGGLALWRARRGALNLNGGRFRNEGGMALVADGLHVDLTVYCRKGSRQTGSRPDAQRRCRAGAVGPGGSGVACCGPQLDMATGHGPPRG